MKQNTNFKYLIFICEFLAVYGGIGYLHAQMLISQKLFLLLMCFSGLIFSLYYGVKGAAFTVLGSGLLLFLSIRGDILTFLSGYYLEASFVLAAFLVSGLLKSHMENRATGIELYQITSEQRLEKFSVELSKKDRALQDVFREVLTDMESPRIVYQALRRLEQIQEREVFFNEILEILYTHCHVEKSGIYRADQGKRFERIASFGASSLPEVLEWKSEEMPEILRVARMKREVIIPKHFEGRRIIMVVPLLSSSDTLLYVILIEEIRFINFNESLISLLKVTAFWIKYILEDRFNREELVPLSVFSSVIVYQPELGKRMIRKSISQHRRYGLPFFMLRVTGISKEEDFQKLAGLLRVYDELFMNQDGSVSVFLSMIIEQNILSVMNRIQAVFPDINVERIRKGQDERGKGLSAPAKI